MPDTLSTVYTRREWTDRTEENRRVAREWWAKADLPRLMPALVTHCVRCDDTDPTLYVQITGDDDEYPTMWFCEPCFWEIEHDYPRLLVIGGSVGIRG